MSRKHPQRGAIIDMARRNIQPSRIAEACALDGQLVRNILAAARKVDPSIPSFRKNGARHHGTRTSPSARAKDVPASSGGPPALAGNGRRELVIHVDDAVFRRIVKMAEKARQLPRQVGEALILQGLERGAR